MSSPTIAGNTQGGFSGVTLNDDHGDNLKFTFNVGDYVLVLASSVGVGPTFPGYGAPYFSTSGTLSLSDSGGNEWTALISTGSNISLWFCIWNGATDSEFTITSDSPDQISFRIDIIDIGGATAISSTYTEGSGTQATATLDSLSISVPLPSSSSWMFALFSFAGTDGSAPLNLAAVLPGFGEDAFGDQSGIPPSGWDDAPVTEQVFYQIASLAGSSGDVVSDICERAGLLSSQIDVSLLTDANIQPNATVTGYLIEQPRSAAEILKVLMQAYFFDGCESGGKMRWIPRGLASAMSIPESDLGLLQDGAKLEESLAQAQDLPQQITVIHNDPVLDYQQNKQLVLRSAQVIGSTRQNIVLQIPMTMDADWARQVAEKALYLAWLERSGYKFNLWRALYMMLDPTDAITFTYEGLNFTARVTENTVGRGFVIEIQCVNENSSNYLSSAEGGVVQGYQTTPALVVGPTQLYLFDIPLIEDTDSNASGTGFYFAFGSAISGWAGAALYESSDDSDFSEVTSDSSNSSATTFGYATTTLAAPVSPWAWDDVNSVTVKLATGSLAGDTELDVLNGSNLAVLGGELIAFMNATQNSDGTWTISNLLRGLRGTEAACSTHGSNELFILVASGLTHQDDPLSVIGVPEYYKAVTLGQDASTAGSQEFTIAGNDLKPYAPVGVGGTVDGSGNIIITWARRTRIGGEADWNDGVADVPLSEDEELYDVDILDGSTVVRTISDLTTPTAVYTTAMQTADFGSTQSSVTANVYQKSVQVGRGSKATGVAPTPGGWPVPWPEQLPGVESSGGQLFYINGS